MIRNTFWAEHTYTRCLSNRPCSGRTHTMHFVTTCPDAHTRTRTRTHTQTQTQCTTWRLADRTTCPKSRRFALWKRASTGRSSCGLPLPESSLRERYSDDSLKLMLNHVFLKTYFVSCFKTFFNQPKPLSLKKSLLFHRPNAGWMCENCSKRRQEDKILHLVGIF